MELEPDRQFIAGYWVEYTRDRTFISGDTKWVRQPHSTLRLSVGIHGNRRSTTTLSRRSSFNNGTLTDMS